MIRHSVIFKLKEAINADQKQAFFDAVDQLTFIKDDPKHIAFVQNYWLKNVEDFLEIDYQI